MDSKQTISALVENRPGVLAHIAGLFASRGFNIDSLTVGETDNANLSRLTIVVRGDEAILEQVRKQLSKIIDVLRVTDLSGQDYVARDLMLIKVNTQPGKRSEIFEVVQVFRGKVVDIGTRHVIIEISGPEEKLQAFIDLMRPYGIHEVVRTGRVAMLRGSSKAGRKTNEAGL